MSEPIAVRAATPLDAPAIGSMLSRAFLDDPAFSWAAPDATRRQRLGPRYFELLIRHMYLPKGETYVTDDATAAALWAPPGQWQVPTSKLLPLFPVMLRACGANLRRALRMLGLMESRHKELNEEHYYLGFVGTEPQLQGTGRGTALLAHVLARCDADGVGAYLEATGLQNQALYHRHGFEVIDELRWPGGGPPFWPMWRDPRVSPM